MQGIASPVILVYHALRLYLIPCCIYYTVSGICKFLRCLFCCCKTACDWVDEDFPPNSSSVGECHAKFKPGRKAQASSGLCGNKADQYLETGGDVKWVRAHQLFKNSGEGHEALFVGGERRLVR